MRKIFTALLAASVLAMPLAATAQVKPAPAGKQAVVQKEAVKKKVVIRKGGWVKGRRLSASDRRRATEIDYRAYRLSTPPRGYHWVRLKNSFLLVGITSGLISKVHEAR
ncbi:MULTISPECIES: RcnB family protein [Rhizobium]|uniref:Ni/Co efflux regulator RcnB n=1 Tax=Rhizobium tropici TaxID=398 RepID=A0A329YMH2_RHITR|nr:MULTISPECIES: RcnB family protein [Rhizobium]MBB3286144.1 Ni/Co efflux regulator RcnB [Rhizobium sp. BK252]MBB3400694.1 Ni/Co efflux regulator RcnB [Rhizobium sp. BK289]MBB3413462.1 Ni/Co efflux regulator RcnB [Rhizobium sp. BK284]MBB3481160.1 Ni/Co efflux regulator RcnB [Rhizobium sp. BK347]MDK4723563.1 RcnB family protein [Rhizobium sp. CNPSo 3968]